MQRPLSHRLWYDFLRISCRLVAITWFRLRREGSDYLPASGGALLMSNHQSYFDPVIVGLACDRRLSYLARKSLFRNPLFRMLINSVHAIPIDREGSGFGGLKETLRRLKQDEVVLIFPEGTRSSDGEVSELKPGFCSLARRGRVPLVPVALDGAYQAWPRDAKLPRIGRVTVVFGPPLEQAEISELTDQELVAEMQRRIQACHARARELYIGQRLPAPSTPVDATFPAMLTAATGLAKDAG